MFRGYGEFHLFMTYFRAFLLFSFSFTCGSNCAAGGVTRLFTCVTDLIWEKWTSGSCAAKLERHDVKKKKRYGKRRKYFHTPLKLPSREVPHAIPPQFIRLN